MENNISVWHIDWTIFVGVVALLTEYFNKMGGGEGKHIFFWSKSTFNYFLFLYSLELKGKLKKKDQMKNIFYPPSINFVMSPAVKVNLW